MLVYCYLIINNSLKIYSIYNRVFFLRLLKIKTRCILFKKFVLCGIIIIVSLIYLLNLLSNESRQDWCKAVFITIILLLQIHSF